MTRCCSPVANRAPLVHSTIALLLLATHSSKRAPAARIVIPLEKTWFALGALEYAGKRRQVRRSSGITHVAAIVHRSNRQLPPALGTGRGSCARRTADPGE